MSWTRRRAMRALALLVPGGAAACGTGFGGGTAFLDELRARCGSVRVDELMEVDVLDPACRDLVEEHLLPELDADLAGLVILGGRRVDENTLEVFIAGRDEERHVIGEEESAPIEAVWEAEGEEVGRGAVGSVDRLRSGSLENLSLAMVLDYSLSMRPLELSLQGTLMRRVLDTLQVPWESKVLFFSSEVEVRVPLSSIRAELDPELAYREDFERGSTALWDAVARAATTLAAEDAPMRLLVVSTDGKDNASVEHDLASAQALVDAHGIPVLIVASLLANRRNLRAFSDTRGVFFYGRNIGRVEDIFSDFIGALGAIQRVQITGIPPGAADALRVAAGRASSVIGLGALGSAL